MSIEHRYPEEALEFRFVHASGPGGQHVNKSSTAVELRVDVGALGLAPFIEQQLHRQQRNRINKRGQLVIYADEFRSQLKNRKAAINRLDDMIGQASVRPKQRIATKPSNSAKRKRLQYKKQRGVTKSQRKKPRLED